MSDTVDELPPDRSPTAKKKWWQFTPVEWGVIVAIFAVLIALLYPDVKSGGGGGASRDRCKNNLKAIGIALHRYHDDHGSFPPAFIADEQGRPLHSWRVLLLPYLDQQKLYEEYRFDEPWNGPHNRRLANRVSKIFHCSTDHAPDAPVDEKYTSYVAVTGPRTAWRGSQPTKLDEITDSRGSTLLVVEACDSNIQWLEPRDLRYSDVAAGINNPSRPWIGSHHKMGVYGLFADGHVGFLIDDLPGGTVRALLTRAGGEIIGEY